MSQASQYVRGKGAAVVLTGDAAVGDVLEGKTFYNTDPNTKLTGTAVFQTGHIQLLQQALQATPTISKAWNQDTWKKTHTPTLDTSWSIA